MRIVISCLLYRHFTGSELYVYDVAHELHRRGHEVRIHASMIGEMFERTDPDIIVSPRTTVPYTPDLIIAQHNIFSKPLIENTDAPVVYICHSRLYEVEHPIVHKNIRKYVSISEDIREWMLKDFGLDSVVIPNGTDANRFKPSDLPKEYGFVPGTYDKTREKFLKRIIEEYKNTSEKVIFCGYGVETIVPKVRNFSVMVPVANVEDYYAKAKWTAGLYLGRVQYESWFCDIPFRAFDEHGEEVIIEKPANLHELTIKNTVDRLLE